MLLRSLLLFLAFRTNEGEVLDVHDSGQIDVETSSMEPLLTRVAANHFNRFRLVANAVQLVRITLNY